MQREPGWAKPRPTLGWWVLIGHQHYTGTALPEGGVDVPAVPSLGQVGGGPSLPTPSPLPGRNPISVPSQRGQSRPGFRYFSPLGFCGSVPNQTPERSTK